MDIVDDAWRKDKLPEEDIAVPLSELPDPESDNGESYMENFGISQFPYARLITYFGNFVYGFFLTLLV